MRAARGREKLGESGGGREAAAGHSQGQRRRRGARGRGQAGAGLPGGDGEAAEEDAAPPGRPRGGSGGRPPGWWGVRAACRGLGRRWSGPRTPGGLRRPALGRSESPRVAFGARVTRCAAPSAHKGSWRPQPGPGAASGSETWRVARLRQLPRRSPTAPAGHKGRRGPCRPSFPPPPAPARSRRRPRIPPSVSARPVAARAPGPAPRVRVRCAGAAPSPLRSRARGSGGGPGACGWGEPPLPGRRSAIMLGQRWLC